MELQQNPLETVTLSRAHWRVIQRALAATARHWHSVDEYEAKIVVSIVAKAIQSQLRRQRAARRPIKTGPIPSPATAKKVSTP